MPRECYRELRDEQDDWNNSNNNNSCNKNHCCCHHQLQRYQQQKCLRRRWMCHWLWLLLSKIIISLIWVWQPPVDHGAARPLSRFMMPNPHKQHTCLDHTHISSLLPRFVVFFSLTVVLLSCSLCWHACCDAVCFLSSLSKAVRLSEMHCVMAVFVLDEF